MRSTHAGVATGLWNMQDFLCVEANELVRG